MESNAVLVRELVKIYSDGNTQIRALNGVDLTIHSGELYGLLGPNGAGKSTLIKILCGLISQTSGIASVQGYDVHKQINTIKAKIGVCPQEPAIFPYLTGRQNIHYFGDLHTIPKKVLKERTENLLKTLSLDHDADRQVKTYSGGMVRRINAAIALINDPEVVFLDEPTVAMDPQSRHALWDFMKELKNRKKTIILTTHYIEEAENLCDRIGIIDYGKLIAEGTPTELKTKYNAKTVGEVFIQITGRQIREND
jgi:ABC-2 type transport system ATP-binding protein